MNRVLLHVCCGPCAIYPFQSLISDGYSVECIFYNPNIQPKEEYLARRNAVEDWQEQASCVVHFEDSGKDFYTQQIQGKSDIDSRCKCCFRLRLQKVADYAQERDFDFFTTTLLVSPYQNQQWIKAIGCDIAEKLETNFLFCDFRPGFRQGHNQAKKLNLYSQKYCGCLPSLKERNLSKKSKEPINAKC